MKQQFKYYAFISFQSADARWALKVQKAVEGYRLPTALQRSQGLPKRIKPCFCYLTDINLNEELMMELQARIAESKYLIVICSPQSAKSTFVNGGIERFVELGRRDCIIPFIVDGVPYSGNPDTECYPEALRRYFPKSSNPFEDHQILGVNVHEAGVSSRLSARKRAIVMVVARMLQLDVNDLIRREVVRQRHERMALIGGIIGVLAVICLTWWLNLPFTQLIQITDAVPNTALPAMQPTEVNLYLDGEIKSEIQPVEFRHIPASERGKVVRMTASCPDYVPLDTMVVLGDPITICMHRDISVYGHVSALLMQNGIFQIGKSVRIDRWETVTDGQGRFSVDIPLEQQRAEYEVCVDGMPVGTLHMPCGENDVFLIE